MLNWPSFLELLSDCAERLGINWNKLLQMECPLCHSANSVNAI